MKKNMLIAIISIIAVIFQSCNKINGVGPVVSKSYNLSGFTSIDAGIDADVYYTQDSFYSVEIQAQQNVLDIIETPIAGGELHIQFEKYKNIWKHDRITVYITAPAMSCLGINGSGNIIANKPISSTYMMLSINGSGNINVASYTGQTLTGKISGSGNLNVRGGSVSNEALRISGSGNMDLLGISAKSVSAEISGSGSATVTVSDNLDVRISGSGSVYYAGNPSVHTEVSGSGKVRKM